MESSTNAIEAVDTAQVSNVLDKLDVSLEEFDAKTQELAQSPEGKEKLAEIEKDGITADEGKEVAEMVLQSMDKSMEGMTNADQMALGAYCASCLDADSGMVLSDTDSENGYTAPTNNAQDQFNFVQVGNENEDNTEVAATSTHDH